MLKFEELTREQIAELKRNCLYMASDLEYANKMNGDPETPLTDLIGHHLLTDEDIKNAETILTDEQVRDFFAACDLEDMLESPDAEEQQTPLATLTFTYEELETLTRVFDSHMSLYKMIAGTHDEPAFELRRRFYNAFGQFPDPEKQGGRHGNQNP